MSCELCWLCLISRWRHQQDLGGISCLYPLCTPHSIHQLVATRGSCGAELVICRGPQPLTGRSMWPFYCDTPLLLFVDPSFEMDPQRSLPHLLMALRLRQRVWWWGWRRKGWWVVAVGARSRVPWGCRGVIWSWNFGIGLFVGSIVMWWRGWWRGPIPLCELPYGIPLFLECIGQAKTIDPWKSRWRLHRNDRSNEGLNQKNVDSFAQPCHDKGIDKRTWLNLNRDFSSKNELYRKLIIGPK